MRSLESSSLVFKIIKKCEQKRLLPSGQRQLAVTSGNGTSVLGANRLNSPHFFQVFKSQKPFWSHFLIILKIKLKLSKLHSMQTRNSQTSVKNTTATATPGKVPKTSGNLDAFLSSAQSPDAKRQKTADQSGKTGSLPSSQPLESLVDEDGFQQPLPPKK